MTEQTDDAAQDFEAPAKPTIVERLRGMARSLFNTRIDKSGGRIRLVALGFAAIYTVIGGKLLWLGVEQGPQGMRRVVTEASSRARPDIVDRNGDILATDVKVDSVFAEPRN
ncbi:MAG TPA: penicillin-binding protein 2, partial [Beijerinckiaceae bacterium]